MLAGSWARVVADRRMITSRFETTMTTRIQDVLFSKQIFARIISAKSSSRGKRPRQTHIDTKIDLQG
jgi:hypothetical protein